MSKPELDLPVIAELTGLRVETPAHDAILEDVSLVLRKGETLGLVGESGSGKTTTALALLGFAQAGAKITAGELRLVGTQLKIGSEREMRRARGTTLTYVPQNPGTALNPSMRIGDAIAEMLRSHGRQSEMRTRIGPSLESVGLPSEAEFQRRYPHQLSGGQQQRVCISVSVVSGAPVVVLDEPTTGLDVVTQAQILQELARLRDEHGMSMVYVTHDLAVVAQVADRIAVMYAGRIIEQGDTEDILRAPRHPYTRGLLTSVPDHIRPHVLEPMKGVSVGVGERPPGCSFAPRCPLRVDACEDSIPELRVVGPRRSSRCIRAEDVAPAARSVLSLGVNKSTDEPAALSVSDLGAEHHGRGGTFVAARNVSFSIPFGSCVALVGESGSGKTTIARTIAGLHPRTTGRIELNGVEVAEKGRRPREQRRDLQMIFQNPSDALNPRRRICDEIARPAKLLRGLTQSEADAEVDRLLDLVRLPRRLANNFPGQLSGGERQRVGIARALAAEPKVIICDEITSALDVSVQAAVLSLLDDLSTKLGLALLFITHDLGVVATIADEVLVLDQGAICESGSVSDVLHAPTHPYTCKLMNAAPSISEALTGHEPVHPDQAAALDSPHAPDVHR